VNLLQLAYFSHPVSTTSVTILFTYLRVGFPSAFQNSILYALRVSDSSAYLKNRNLSYVFTRAINFSLSGISLPVYSHRGEGKADTVPFF